MRGGSASRWLVRVLVPLVVVAGICCALVWTQGGRDTIANWVQAWVSDRIPGTMKIGRLESVGWARPVATNVEFFTPKGERVMKVDRAEVDLDLVEMMAGKIAFKRARADGGVVVVEVLPGGVTTMETALRVDAAPGERTPLELHNIHFERITMLLRLSGETRFIIRDLEGFVRVWCRDTPGVRIDVGQTQGVFEKPEITGDKIELVRLDGQVWAREHHLVSLTVSTRIGNGGIDADFDYYDRDHNAAVLTLRPETGSGARLASAVIALRSWFMDELEVTIER